MLRPSNCSSLGRLVHAVLWYANPAIDQTCYLDAWKKYRKNYIKSLPEDEHLDVRNMSKKLKLKH